ncbi:hypothetical protein DPMN_084592 [Dreissena polymorpha]|uniref:Uncharacterized protein n=1 Tax=Dreissena polymorpha TaxID=45954 RepID=A0A9D4BIN8_DREPO|nr:hypothetical protein DPMN_084592 [Dreissena polymorpha]
MYTGKKNPVTPELISKTKMVIAYDKFMGGVDRADQMDVIRHTRHFPYKIPNGEKSKSLQFAQMLASQGLPKKRRPGHETAYKFPCFKLYHSMQDYILAYKRLQAEEKLTDASKQLPICE